MASVSGLTRAGEWWSYKIPPLLAIAYALLLVAFSAGWPGVGLIGLSILSIIAVAAYGYVINDCFDIEVDRLAGKTNSMADRSPAQRAGILLVILAIGWAPAFAGYYPGVACVLLAIDFLLPTIYSIPPIRLKERGVLAVISDASAAHFVPTLFIATVLFHQPGIDERRGWSFVVAAATWYVLVGLRAIINHQIIDREADERSGVVTLATTQGQLRFLRWARRLLYLSEMACFLSVIVLLAPHTFLVLPTFVAFAVFESAKRMLGWEYIVERTVQRGRRFYLPFANNLYYALWFPLILAVDLAIRWPWLAWLPLVHLALFAWGRGNEYREPFVVAQDLRHAFMRWTTRRRFGWNVNVHRSHWPAIRQRQDAEEGSILRVEPTKAHVHPWDLKLMTLRYPIVEGSAYQLRLRLRSDRPRSITVGVGQRHSPWRDLGVAEVIPVTEVFEDFLFDFTATATDVNACVFLWLGGSDSSVEIQEARLVCVTAPGPWSIVQTKPAQAWRSRPEDEEYLVRVDRIQATGTDWHVRLSGGKFDAKAHQLYRVHASIRSEEPRPLTFGVAHPYPPFDVVGNCEEVAVIEEFQDFQLDFVTDVDDQLSFFLWLGGDESPIEVLAFECRPIEISRRWFLDHAPGRAAWRVTTLDPERVVVEIAHPVRTQDSVVLRTPLDLPASGDGTVAIDLWVGSGTGTITFGVAEIVDGRSVSLVMREVSITEPLQRLETGFLVLDRSRHHEVFLWLGSLADVVEVRSFAVEPSGPAGVWMLEHEPGMVVHQWSGDDSSICVRNETPAEKPFAARLVGSSARSSIPAGYWSLKLRSDRPDRPVCVAVIQAAQPTPELIRQVDLPLGTEWQDVVVPVPFSGEIKWPVIWFGQGEGSVEIGDWSSIERDPHTFWELALSESATAQLSLTDAGTKVDIDSLGSNEWSVQLRSTLPAVRAGACYRLRVSVRGATDRPVTVSVNHSDPPYEPIGLCAETHATSEWMEQVFDFEASMAESEPMLILAVGRDQTSVEVGPWSFESIDRSQMITPMSVDHGSLQVTSALERDRVRMVPIGAAGDPWSRQAIFLPLALEVGRNYRFRIGLAVDAPRTVTVGVKESNPPHASLGLCIDVPLPAGPSDLRYDFQATASTASAVPFLAFGNESAPIEVTSCSLELMEGEITWRPIQAAAGSARAGGIADHPDVLRVHLDDDQTDPWAVRLDARIGTLTSRQPIRVRVDLRADRERTISLGLAQDHEPWATISKVRSTRVTTDWRVREFDLSIDQDELATLLFAVGGEAGWLDIRSVQVHAIDPAAVLEVSAAEGLVSREASPECPEATRFVLEPTSDPWKVRVLGTTLEPEPARDYRITVRLASDDARQVLVGMKEVSESGNVVGKVHELAVDSTRRHFVLDWRSPDESEGVRPFICVGGSSVPVEIDQLAVSKAPERGEWRLEDFEHRAVRLAGDGNPDLMLFEVRDMPSEPWKVKLVSPKIEIERGRAYRFQLRLRSDRPAEIDLGLSQAQPPWKGLGLHQTIKIDTDGCDWTHEWVADLDEPQAQFYIWLGRQSASIEVSAFEYKTDGAAHSSKEHEGGNGKVNVDADDVDHAGDERARTISGVDAQTEHDQG